MRIFGPLGHTDLELRVPGPGNVWLSAPVDFVYQAIMHGKPTDFSWASLVGTKFKVNGEYLRFTRTHWERLREALSAVGVIKMHGQGVPSQVLVFGPVIHIVAGCKDWAPWTIGETTGPFRPVEVNYGAWVAVARTGGGHYRTRLHKASKRPAGDA